MELELEYLRATQNRMFNKTQSDEHLYHRGFVSRNQRFHCVGVDLINNAKYPSPSILVQKCSSDCLPTTD